MSSSGTILLSMITIIQALSLPEVQAPGTNIKWAPCPQALNKFDPHNRTLQCGTLDVPLDYTDKTSDLKLSLDIIKIPALREPKRGSILFNWGGPGGTGLLDMAVMSSTVQPMTGGYHDLVSWDPRGTGKTLALSCFANSTDRDVLNTLHMDLANASDTSLGRSWAEGNIISSTCSRHLNQTGRLVGTVFTVRDMFQIVDNLGEDGKLRYWGVSYGTTLGATALAMFPDRIDRAILDGVQNTHEYYHSFGDPEMYTDTDKTWEEFISACLKMPGNCALAKHATTAAELGEKLDRLMDEIKYHPIPAGKVIIDYTSLKSIILANLYYPQHYPDLATKLDAILSKNASRLATIGIASPASADQSTFVEATLAIKCGDKFRRTDNLQEVRAELEGQLYKTSARFGDTPTLVLTTCPQWQFSAKERYEGDFRAKTSYPVLIIGNTYDPVTPLKSAYNMSKGFEGSVVLQHNGHGHMSFWQVSSCTTSYISNYFVSGTLPAPGTTCEPDSPLFGKEAISLLTGYADVL